MNWIPGIGLAVAVILWLAMEIATQEDKGRDAKYHFNIVKKSLLVIIPLFAFTGVIYYVFLN